MRTDDLDFKLPPELIAQSPPTERAASKLLHYRRDTLQISHHTFSDLPKMLRPGDLLVFNDAQVVPAKFSLRKDSGGAVEGLFLDETSSGRWRVLLRNLGNAKSLTFAHSPELTAAVVQSHGAGEVELAVSTSEPAIVVLAQIGRMPLPPYIRRAKDRDDRDAADRERYQTTFAKIPGAVAAPTAGLHFTPTLFAELDALGIERAFVTLHVGLGTFKPVVVDELAQHAMHSEAYSIDQTTADALNRAKRDSRRIVAVGTTSARVIESQPADQAFAAKSGETSIFIYPPYEWKHVGAMITNFHLPRSTLIALVAAMIGLEEQQRVYETAIAEQYRFFSYGDAMFID